MTRGRPGAEHFGPDGDPKRRFATFREAEIFAREQQARGGSNRRPYQAYACTFDGVEHFHIGKRLARGSARAKTERARFLRKYGA